LALSSHEGITSQHVLVVSAAFTILFAALACSGHERRSERIYREAAAQIESGNTEAAVEKLEVLVRDYADTPAGKKATKEIVLYRGIADAVRRYPERRAAEAMIRTARAIESFHVRRKEWPAQLSDLVPEELTKTILDPWGRPLGYEKKPGGSGYRLTCLGGDGAPGGVDENADLIVEDGRFLQGGLQ
jgi:hypothetical protein